MVRFHIRGLSPLIQHNGQLADPMNEWTRALSALTSKKKKTDKDREEIGRVEFMGGLYIDEAGHPCIPGENIESMLQVEGRRNKMGRQVQAGIICDGLFPLQYDGPKEPEGLWERRAAFALRKGVRNQMNRVIRTRPIFRDWRLTFDVEVIAEEINAPVVIGFVEAAGRHTGMGDWRPRFGRFVVEKAEEVQ